MAVYHLYRSSINNENTVKRGLTTPFQLSGYGWGNRDNDAGFAFACIDLLALLICLFLSFRTRWTTSNGKRDRTTGIAFKVATVSATLTRAITVADYVATNQIVVVTHAYLILYVVQAISMKIGELLIIWILYRYLESCRSATRPSSSTRRSRLINNLLFTALVLASGVFFVLYTSYIAADIVDNEHTSLLCLLYSYYSHMSYCALYLVISIQILVLILKHGFQAQDAKRPGILLLIIGLCLFVSSLTFLVFDANVVGGKAISSLWMSLGASIVYGIATSVQFVVLLLLGLKTPMNTRGLDDSYADDGNVASSELLYQPSRKIAEEPYAPIYEVPLANLQRAKMTYHPSSPVDETPTNPHTSTSIGRGGGESKRFFAQR